MRKLIIWLVIISLVAVVSCKRKTRLGIAKETGEKAEIVTTAEINDNPEKYQNQECTVSGYVTTVLDISGIKNDFFKIFDGTDEIWVYTNRGIPPLNIRGIVKGTCIKFLDFSFLIPIIKIPIISEISYFIVLKEFKFARNQ